LWCWKQSLENNSFRGKDYHSEYLAAARRCGRVLLDLSNLKEQGVRISSFFGQDALDKGVLIAAEDRVTKGGIIDN
jgi:hypothetical protein